MRATVLALGDLGRSPRIQLHARELADASFAVDLLGFGGSACWLLDDVRGVTLRLLNDSKALRSRTLRGIGLFLSLSRALRDLESPGVVLVQTPPALPALWLAARFGRKRRARVVFDWHNLGFSLLALRAGEGSVSTAGYKAGERVSAQGADAHLCVSAGLRDALRRHFGINAQVFEDHPSRVFRPASFEAQRSLREELLSRAGLPKDSEGLVVVSPTSWTPDEDFPMLEAAADRVDLVPGGLITIIVSGRGELKEGFEARQALRQKRRVQIRTVWLEGRDYPRLLPGADLGLSLHASSSGVDFPMKIHDLKGSGLKVLARAFAGLSPQFVAGRDGFAFATADELAGHLSNAAQDPASFSGLPGGASVLTWEEAWQRDARSVILG